MRSEYRSLRKERSEYRSLRKERSDCLEGRQHRTGPFEARFPHASDSGSRAVAEREALMAEGRTNAVSAESLFIGTGAVQKNVTAIFQKLRLDDSGSDHRRVLGVLARLQR